MTHFLDYLISKALKTRKIPWTVKFYETLVNQLQNNLEWLSDITVSTKRCVTVHKQAKEMCHKLKTLLDTAAISKTFKKAKLRTEIDSKI